MMSFEIHPKKRVPIKLQTPLANAFGFDYGDDGYMIVWDSEEIGRNVTVENLSKRIKECDDELYNKLIKHMNEELQLPDFSMADDYLTQIMEFLTKETEGLMYMFYYQNSCREWRHA